MKIVIPGEPIPKKRHRCGCRGGFPIAYDEQVSKEMASIKQIALSEWTKQHQSGNKQIEIEASNLARADSFRVVCTFVFPVPQKFNQFNRNAKLWGFSQHNTKPDVDNLAKLYIDCLTGIIWRDDGQVTISVSKKVYGENPRTELEIMAETGMDINSEAKKILCVFSPSELERFIDDAHELVFFKQPVNEFDESETNDAYMELSANQLVKFAHAHGDKIRKLQKFMLFSESTQE